MSNSNSILVIFPYRLHGTWVFNDAAVDLLAEPFVSGIPAIIDNLIERAGLTDYEDGFAMYFSDSPFPGYQDKVVHMNEEYSGNWYKMESTGMCGWLCPALFKYFASAPKEIYVKVENINLT